MRLSELPEIDDTLRPYQVTGKKEIYRAWDTCRTVLFQMPTGTGKTRLFSSIIKDIRRLWQEDKVIRRVLVLAHRKELIDQIDETLSFKYGISHGIIKSGVEETWNRTVQVASVQTIVRRLDKWSSKEFAYIIIDEAHHAVSSTYMKICKQFPDAKILGVTATPCRLTGDALRRLFGVLVISQPVSKFIEQGYLSPYSYYSIKPNSRIQLQLDNISHFNIDGDYAEADMMRVFDTTKVRANIIDAYLKYAKDKKGIVYTINQEHNKHICEAYEKIGVKIKAIDSKTPAEERKNTVAQFKSGKIDIICNVNIFSEGFDCPDIEFIQLARPTCSLAMYLQQVGRGLRPHPKGIPATILDNVGSFNKFGLPSANRKWRSHFEGEGQRVTRSQANNAVTGGGRPRNFQEGDEEMTLIFSGVALSTPDIEFYPILKSISETYEWFPLGYEALIDPYQSELLQSFHKADFYGVLDDLDWWTDDVESSLEGLAEEEQNQNRQEEVKWVEHRIRNTFRFYHEGKYGLVYLHNSPDTLREDRQLYYEGKKSIDDIATILLTPVYDEIGIGDNRDFSICKKDGLYGVIDGETMTTQVPFEYDAIDFQVTGEYIAEKNGKKGLINRNGEIIIPFDYEFITQTLSTFDEVFFFALRNGRYEVFIRRGKAFEELSVQRELLKGLPDNRFIGRLTNHLGAICNAKGYVFFPLHFELIGIIPRGKSNARYYLEAEGFYALLDDRLNVIEGLTQAKEDHDETYDLYNFERAYVITKQGAEPWRREKMQQQKKVESIARPEEEKEGNAIGIVDIPVLESHEAPNNETENSMIHPVPSKPQLPSGVIQNEEGLQGFEKDGITILEPVYESVTPYGSSRLIVMKDGKYGVLSINGEKVTELVPCIFKGLKATKKHKYSVQMGGGYSEAHNEEFLKSVLQQTDQHLIIRMADERIAIFFHSRQIGIYKEVIYLGKDVFIVVNDDDKYGLIRAGTIRPDIIRPFEYTKIELSEDKRNVLLFKTGRPRFITIHSLLNKD